MVQSLQQCQQYDQLKSNQLICQITHAPNQIKKHGLMVSYIKKVNLYFSGFLQGGKFSNDLIFFIVSAFYLSLDFLLQHTEERASLIIDRLIDIVRSLYRVDEEVTTTCDKIHLLSLLNSSTVNNLEEFIRQNWSFATENATIDQQITGNDEPSTGYSMKFWLRITWDLLFFIIIFVAIVGNLLVLWIVTGKS